MAAGAGLTPSSGSKSPLFSNFRGSVFRGTEAAVRASAVSGPFQAAPTAYVIPEDEDDLGRLIRWAWENEIPLIPRGAGTGMPGGNLGPSVVVEIGPGFRDLVLDPESSRIRAGAGAVGAGVDRAARGIGGFLPFLPSSGRWCTVGGMVANNAAGARSFRHGAICAWVEGLEGFYSWGERFNVGPGEPLPGPFAPILSSLRQMLSPTTDGCLPGWPSIRKNASGYALDRFLRRSDPAQLLVGSEGTLAFITRADLRFAPLPEGRGLAMLRAEGPDALTELALRADSLGATACEFLGRRLLELVETGLDPDVAELSAEAFALVIFEVMGPPDEVQSKLRALEQIGARTTGAVLTTRDPEAVDRFWAIRHAASPIIAREADRGRFSTQFIEDSVVPPSALGTYLAGLDEILSGVRLDAVVFGHAGDANVHVNPLIEVEDPDWELRVRRALDEVTDLVAGLGGSLSGEHGDGRLRAPLLSRIWPPTLVRGFEKVKEALDPKGILNPGVIMPLPGQDPLEGLVPQASPHPT